MSNKTWKAIGLHDDIIAEVGQVIKVAEVDENNKPVKYNTVNTSGVYVQDTEPSDAIEGDIWVDTAHDPSFIVPSIPEITSADNGKVLMVVDGELKVVTLNLTTDTDGVMYI